MRLSSDQARSRLAAQVHGVLATTHPTRGPDPQPVVYAVSDDGHVGVPIDQIKPKASTRLQREDNLEADPRVRVLLRGRWYSGRASVTPLDHDRLSSFNLYARSGPTTVGIDPLLVRVEISPS